MEKDKNGYYFKEMELNYYKNLFIYLPDKLNREEALDLIDIGLCFSGVCLNEEEYTNLCRMEKLVYDYFRIKAKSDNKLHSYLLLLIRLYHTHKDKEFIHTFLIKFREYLQSYYTDFIVYKTQLYDFIECLQDINRITNFNISLDKYFYAKYIQDLEFMEIFIKSNYYKFSNKNIYFSEKELKKSIIKHFEFLFPKYKYIGTEISVNKIGKIDILAKDKKSKRDVIIELKKDKDNPNMQLIAYGSAYNTPILIWITNMDSKNYIEGITYIEVDTIRDKIKTLEKEVEN